MPLVSSATPPAIRAKLRAHSSETSLAHASNCVDLLKFGEAILALHQVDLSARGTEAKALYERALLDRPLEREIIARSSASALPGALRELAEISRRGPEPLLDLAERSGVSLSEPRKYDRWALPRTAFEQAVRGGDAPLALTLVDRLDGMDLEREFAGLRPLARAASSGNAALARGLVERGADPASPSPSGSTAFDLAIAGGHHATALAILDGHRALRSMRALLDAGADPNAEDGAGMTPFLYVASASDPGAAREMVSLLFERGADLNARSRFNNATAEERLQHVEKGRDPRRADFARSALDALRACRREASSIDAWFPFG